MDQMVCDPITGWTFTVRSTRVGIGVNVMIRKCTRERATPRKNCSKVDEHGIMSICMNAIKKNPSCRGGFSFLLYYM